ncbi:acyl-CoA N-acyltransferase [Podospora aff. communis PSN243]|uniref:Acyl-CoA N-acyltransferase n=1 Tax=Podospora aff. communis PSN243 TaxID=3040156 RepID=A0AAV9GAV4_9PEZI|nr:acyl-CoA N-acyltransferase [Podospora aff. communis PSN243]
MPPTTPNPAGDGPTNGPTPFISIIGPSRLRFISNSYVPTLRHNEQPLRKGNDGKVPIPKLFLDAMSVREAVYVDEQGVPLEHEFDSEDPRSVHWVIYASVQKPVADAVTDPDTGAILVPRRSETTTVPIGTIRLVPFPHGPPPRAGGDYVSDELVNAGADIRAISPYGGGDSVVTDFTPEEKERLRKPYSYPPQYDDASELHDGQEPYLKLGRLAVLKEFRGRGIGSQLIRTAIKWIAEQPDLFDPIPSDVGFAKVQKQRGGVGLMPRWNGLFCCHAQEAAVPLWQRHGFHVDKSRGRWMEEGIPHVAMFLRVGVEKAG